MSTVLVTGGSGFVGAHIIIQLLKAGHRVRATLRDASKEAALRGMLREGGVSDDSALALHGADLTRDAGWARAAGGCDYVLHVASPFPAGRVRDEDELLVPAREGTLRVLRAAREAGVRRVVCTSSFAAIGYGHAPRATPYTEADWTEPGGGITSYTRSKLVAERAAWDFITREGGGMELAVINPVGIFGPVLGPDYASSAALIRMLLDGSMPIAPRLYFGAVDARDVADLHLRAMTHPEAAGQRFIATAGPARSLLDIARILRRHCGPAARKTPRLQSPDWLTRVLARFSPALEGMLPQLGVVRHASSDKARQVLGWSPRTDEEAIAACGASLLKLGLVKSAA